MAIAETVLPGIYITERTEGLGAPVGGDVNKILIFGTASKGEVGVPIPIEAEREVRAAFGLEDAWNMGTTATKTPLGLVRGLKMALKKSSNITAFRVTDGSEQEATFEIKDESLNTICTLSGISPGTWAHDIQIYIEDSTQPAIIENEQHDGTGILKLFSLEFNNIVRSISNSFVIITPSGTDPYDPIYYKTDTIDYAGAVTDRQLSASNQRASQTFLTVSPLTLEAMKISMKKSQGILDTLDETYNYDYNAGSHDYDDVSDEANDGGIGVDDVPIGKGTVEDNDALYIGQAVKFDQVHFNFDIGGDVNTLADIVYEFWNGTTWATITPSSDTTINVSKPMEQTGNVTWTVSGLTNWTAASLDATTAPGSPPATSSYYWIRARISAANAQATQVAADYLQLREDLPDGTITVGIYNVDAQGNPNIAGGLVNANATFTIDVETDLSTSYADIAKNFTGQFSLSSDKTYALVFLTSSVIYRRGTIDWEVINDTTYYYEDGKQLYYDGATWSSTNYKQSMLFQLKPVLDANDVAVRMRNWDANGTASIEFLNAPTSDDVTDSTYKVSGDNTKVKKITFNHDGNREEFIAISGEDLARDINNSSTGSVWFSAEADVTYGGNSPGIIPENGTEDFPKSPSGGSNGQEASPTDYDEAIGLTDILDGYIVIIASAGRYNYQPYLDDTHPSDDLAALHGVLKDHVEKMQSEGVERITVLGMRESKISERTVSGIGTFMTSANDSIDNRLDRLGNTDGRVIFIASGIKITDELSETEETIMCGQMTASNVAGLISSLLGWKSPTRESISGALDLEINFNRSARVTLLKLNAFVLELAGSIRVVQGITTDPTLKFREISVRRSVDFLRINVYITLDAYIGDPASDEILGAVESKVNDVMEDLRINGYIKKGYSVEVYTTAAGEQAGKVNVDLRFTVIKPINKFMVTAYVN